VDLPYVEPTLLHRLMVEHPAAAALAPRREGRWEPLFARYCPGPALVALDAALADGRRALQSVFDGLGAGAVELPLAELDWPLLRDWDRPDDVSGVYQE
jgi:molybdopterin-guanine dinucleotide biosynthesis protein A